MGPNGMNFGSGHMLIGPFGMNGFDLGIVANVTDDNFTDVQAKIVDSLGNMISMLKDQLNDMKISQDSNELKKSMQESLRFKTYLLK
jgi:hypothetical protein